MKQQPMTYNSSKVKKEALRFILHFWRTDTWFSIN